MLWDASKFARSWLLCFACGDSALPAAAPWSAFTRLPRSYAYIENAIG